MPASAAVAGASIPVVANIASPQTRLRAEEHLAAYRRAARGQL